MSDYAHYAREKLQEAIELMVKDQDYELAAQTRELCARVRNTDPTGYYQEEAEALQKANDTWQESHRLQGNELEKTKAELKEVRSVSEGWEAAYNRARDASNAHLMAKDSLMEKCSEQAKQLKEYEGTVFMLRNQISELNEGISELKTARNNEKEKWETEFVNKELVIASLEVTSADLRVKLGEVTDKHNELEKCFQDEIDTNKFQAGIAEETIATQLDKIITLEAKAEADHNRIVGLREQIEKIKEARLVEVKDRTDALHKCRLQLEDWRVAEKMQRECKESYAERIKEYQLEIDRLREKMRAAGL